MFTAYVKTDGHVEVHDTIDPGWLDDDSQAVVWVDIIAPDEQDARMMREVLSLHELAIEDALGEVHSPKVESYPGILYVILHGIDHTASEHSFATHDVDFFLGRNFLVTVHDGTFRSLKRVAEICPRSEHLLAEGPASLMHRIVDLMVDNYRPEVDELDDWIDEIEKQIFDSPAALHVKDILELKRDVVSLRRVTIPQRDVVGRLARREFSEIDMSVAFRFRDVYDHLVRIADEATVFSDRITSLLDAHLSATSNRLNEVVKVLTIITTVFGPLTVLSGLFGMNVHLPLFPGDDTTQFYWVLGMMALAVGGMLLLLQAQGLDQAGGACRLPPTGYVMSPASRIRRLPSDLANQIAAGEVVERPASAVKELVENSLDAGARRISVTVELGGKRLIRVEDDGMGMPAEDAVLAIERHATSRIARAEDLAAIMTLGFRGEALPSIASVSHFVLRTRARGETSGTEIRVNGGTVASVREVGAAEGTVIEVADLFYNLPARRKFLKADSAESAQVSRVVTQVALAYPEVGFTLVSAGRRTLECPPVATFAERFFQLYGERDDLVEVHREGQSLRVFGLVAALTENGPTRGPQNVYVNGRVVKDRTISHAIIAAYAIATIKERSPEAHLFLEMPPDRVDVNVHPTKAEVRFLDQGFVHEFLRHAVGDALGAQRAPDLQLAPPSRGDVPGEPSAQPLPNVLDTMVGAHRWVPPADSGRPIDVPAYGMSIPRTGPVEVSAAGVASSPVGAPMPAIRPMIPLGQFRDTYIIAVDDEGVVIVDQHVAHERVLFEDISARLEHGRLPAQKLITPLLLEMTPTQLEVVVQHRDNLDRLGIEVEEFGAGSLRVSCVPAMLGAEDAAATIRSLANDLEGFDRGARAEEALRRIAATMACHAAVKANYPLTLEKMRHILDELRRTAYSSVCPHGRPVVLRLSRREIEKNFQRI